MGACPSLTETEQRGILPERPQARGQQNRAQNLFPSRFSSEVLPPLRCWHPDLFLDRCQETSWEVSRQGGCQGSLRGDPPKLLVPGQHLEAGTGWGLALRLSSSGAAFRFTVWESRHSRHTQSSRRARAGSQGRSAADGRYVLNPGLPKLTPSLKLFMGPQGILPGPMGWV